MITFKGVSKIYNIYSTALEDVDFHIEPGEFVSLAGRSGSGKSTIIRLLIGEEKPSKGRVFFGQYEVNKLKDVELPAFRRHIGVVFQDFRLLSTKNAYENVAFALEVAGRPQREISELVPQVLDMVGLADRMKNFPHELSGGEQQRVAIARALAQNPRLVLADEPTGNLDDKTGNGVMSLLDSVTRQAGKTLIMVTHSRQIAGRADRVFEMSGGELKPLQAASLATAD
jgi:cell division transport system ATP-binding protein